MVKNSPAGDTRDAGLIPGPIPGRGIPGRSSGEGNGKPLQNSCPGNPKDRGAWQVTSKGSEKTGFSD